MPNGTESVQEAVNLRAVSDKLKARRDRIASLPVDKQLAVYGVAFDRFVKPHLTKSGVTKDEDLDMAKDRWIVGLIAPEKQQPLPKDFGVDKPPRSYLTEASAELVGIGAGAAGGVKNIADFAKSHQIVGSPEQWLFRQFLEGTSKVAGKVEEKGYKLAHEVDPKAAEFGAGFGHLLPSIAAYEVGAGLIPAPLAQAGAKTPMAVRLLYRLGRAATGGAAGAVPYGAKTGEEVATSAAINTAIDAILGGLGKVGSKGARQIISKVTSSGNAAHVAAANAVDDLLSTVLKSKFPGRSLDSLSPTEFDQVFKEAQAQRSTAQAKAKEAAKAVRDAKAAVEAPKPKGHEQVLEKERLKAAKQAERREAAERNKKLVKQLAEYKRRVGSLPTQESDHFKRLAAGETAEQILGPEPQQAAKQAEEATKQQIVTEGASQAVEAVQVVQDAGRGGERRVAAGVSPTGTERRKTLIPGVTTVFDLPTEGEKLEKSMRESKAKKSPFNTDVSKIIGATTPEEFAHAKKEAKDAVIEQAKKFAEKFNTTTEKLKIAQEAKKEMKRIDQMPTPEAFSVKTKDAARKVAEAKGTAGSVPVESVKDLSYENPELAMERNEQLLAELKVTASTQAVEQRVLKAIKGKDLLLQNQMLKAAIDALRGIKK